MSEYTMRGLKYNCGPAAISAVTDRPYEEACRVMGWRGWEDARDNALDSPPAHFEALKKLNIPYRIVDANQIIRGECVVGKTVVLIHGVDIPDSWLIQHWVVLAAVTPVDVRVFMGDGTIRSWNHDLFRTVYTRGGPTNTAYEVGVDGKKNTRWNWWGKLMKWMFGR